MRIDIETYKLSYLLTLRTAFPRSRAHATLAWLWDRHDRLPSAALLLANTLEPVFADSLRQACEGRRN